MKNLYKDLKDRQQKESNALPLYFAFGKNQMDELIKKLGFESEEELLKNVFTIGAGSIILKKDRDLVINTFKRHDEELKEAFRNDDFLQSAFEYELSNHEYIMTYDKSETLHALGISQAEYNKNERYQKLMTLAIENYKKDMEALGW